MTEPVDFATFLAGAREFASMAMTDRARGNPKMFALHAGAAVEHLAKGVLASKSPALLLDLKGGRRRTDMLYQLTGMKSVSAEKVWTIGATEAISRLRDLGVLSSDEMLNRLVELRNGVAHFTRNGMAEDLLPTFARTVDVLLSHVSFDHEEFWGTWHPAALVAVSEAHNKVQQEVHLRIQDAKQLYLDRASIQPHGDMREYENRHSEHKHSYELGYYEDYIEIVKRVDCPACPRLARVQMTVSVDDITDGRALYKMDQLFCSHCRLRLSGQAELEAAGLESALEVGLSGNSIFSTEVRAYIKDRDHWIEEWRIRGERRLYAERLRNFSAEADEDDETDPV